VRNLHRETGPVQETNEQAGPATKPKLKSVDNKQHVNFFVLCTNFRGGDPRYKFQSTYQKIPYTTETCCVFWLITLCINSHDIFNEMYKRVPHFTAWSFWTQQWVTTIIKLYFSPNNYCLVILVHQLRLLLHTVSLLYWGKNCLNNFLL
jgi:hypothetical protein